MPSSTSTTPLPKYNPRHSAHATSHPLVSYNNPLNRKTTIPFTARLASKTYHLSSFGLSLGRFIWHNPNQHACLPIHLAFHRRHISGISLTKFTPYVVLHGGVGEMILSVCTSISWSAASHPHPTHCRCRSVLPLGHLTLSPYKRYLRGTRGMVIGTMVPHILFSMGGMPKGSELHSRAGCIY